MNPAQMVAIILVAAYLGAEAGAYRGSARALDAFSQAILDEMEAFKAAPEKPAGA